MPGTKAGAATPSDGNCACLPEGSDRSVHQGARADVADEGDEVAAVGIEEAERRRVALAAGLVAVAAEHLEREHRAQRLAALARAARRHPAAHLRAHGSRAAPRWRRRRSGSAGAPLRAGPRARSARRRRRRCRRRRASPARCRSARRRRWRPDRAGTPRRCCTRAPAALEVLQRGGEAVGREGARDVAHRGIQVGIALGSREGLDVAPQPCGEGALFVGKRRQRAGVRRSRHGGEVPKRGDGEDCRDDQSREDEEKVDRLTRERV